MFCCENFPSSVFTMVHPIIDCKLLNVQRGLHYHLFREIVLLRVENLRFFPAGYWKGLWHGQPKTPVSVTSSWTSVASSTAAIFIEKLLFEPQVARQPNCALSDFGCEEEGMQQSRLLRPSLLAFLLYSTKEFSVEEKVILYADDL